MKVIDSNNVSSFDCDGTLIIWAPPGYSFDDDILARKTIQYPLQVMYGDEVVYLRAHKKHPQFLKHCSNRGDTIIVWSMNGVEWCKIVVELLGLEDYVDIVMSKPSRHIDDSQTIESVVGNRVWINED